MRYVAPHQRACSYGRQSSAVTHEQIVDAEVSNRGALYLSCVDVLIKHETLGSEDDTLIFEVIVMYPTRTNVVELCPVGR